MKENNERNSKQKGYNIEAYPIEVETTYNADQSNGKVIVTGKELKNQNDRKKNTAQRSVQMASIVQKDRRFLYWLKKISSAFFFKTRGENEAEDSRSILGRNQDKKASNTSLVEYIAIELVVGTLYGI